MFIACNVVTAETAGRFKGGDSNRKINRTNCLSAADIKAFNFIASGNKPI